MTTDPNKNRHYSPLKGRSVPFAYAHVQAPKGAKTDPAAYNASQQVLRQEHKDFHAAAQSMRQQPGSWKVTASPENYRNRHKDAAARNKAKHTAYKGENLSKVTSKPVNGMESHAIMDNKSGKKWGDKPVSVAQRAKENSFRDRGNNMTAKGKTSGPSSGGGKAPQSKLKGSQGNAKGPQATTPGSKMGGGGMSGGRPSPSSALKTPPSAAPAKAAVRAPSSGQSNSSGKGSGKSR
ncbi:hypothetical protein ECE50_004425 [Chitinophaga sp. Mgbs1]|uniref:Uncharacterized protein n=1 Tax=Chitinophaga solisilvae TaxID=1233460 RepID=A0A3S1B2B7_9BACT|nr:hypothetical protein [Chitinophaga solisilvae]